MDFAGTDILISDIYSNDMLWFYVLDAFVKASRFLRSFKVTRALGRRNSTRLITQGDRARRAETFGELPPIAKRARAMLRRRAPRRPPFPRCRNTKRSSMASLVAQRQARSTHVSPANMVEQLPPELLTKILRSSLSGCDSREATSL